MNVYVPFHLMTEEEKLFVYAILGPVLQRVAFRHKAWRKLRPPPRVFPSRSDVQLMTRIR